MTTKTEALRTAITVLTAQLAIEEGKAPGAYIPAFDTDEAERKRLAEIAESLKPHAYVPWGPGVLPSQSGTNEQPPASWESHKIMWEAAMRGDPVTPGGPNILTNGIPGWPDANGRPFRIFDYLPLGPEAIHAAIAHLYTSPTGQAWLASVGDTWPQLRKQPTRW